MTVSVLADEHLSVHAKSIGISSDAVTGIGAPLIRASNARINGAALGVLALMHHRDPYYGD